MAQADAGQGGLSAKIFYDIDEELENSLVERENDLVPMWKLEHADLARRD